MPDVTLEKLKLNDCELRCSQKLVNLQYLITQGIYFASTHQNFSLLGALHYDKDMHDKHHIVFVQNIL